MERRMGRHSSGLPRPTPARARAPAGDSLTGATCAGHHGGVVRTSRAGRELELKPLWFLLILLLPALVFWPRTPPRAARVSGSAPPRVHAPLTAGPASASPGLSLPTFPHVARSRAVCISADVDQPIDELCAFAGSTLRSLRAELGGGERADPPTLNIYLCAEVEEMRRLEAAYGWPRSDPAPQRTFEFRGGFYPEPHLILLHAQAGEDLRFAIAHELSHAVFNELVGQSCDALDEGLADYDAARVLGWEPGPYRLEATAKGVLQGSLPSLARFFALDYWQFRDDKLEGRSFELSQLLVRVLLEDRSPAIAGRFPLLLRNLRAADPWNALRRTYDVRRLESVWKDALESASRWFPVYGAWSQTNEARVVTLRSPGTAVLLHREPPRAGEAYTIRVRAASTLDSASELGFVLGYEDAHSYEVLTLRRSERGLVVARCVGDRWGRSTFTPVRDFPADWSTAELSLACSAQGTLVLRFGSRVLAQHARGMDAFGGRVGLFVQPHMQDPSGGGRIAFEYVDFCAESPAAVPASVEPASIETGAAPR